MDSERHDLSKFTVPTKVVGMQVVSALPTNVVGIQATIYKNQRQRSPLKN